MKKSGAIIGVIITVIIAIIGISAYSSGSSYMTFLGIKLSAGGFVVLICIFLAYDIIAFVVAGKKDKAIKAEVSQAAVFTAPDNQLSFPCNISITRSSSMVGAAMSVEVFLNGALMGSLKSGKTLTFPTMAANNRLTVRYTADNSTRSIDFVAAPSGNIQIQLKYTGGVLTIVQNSVSTQSNYQ